MVDEAEVVQQVLDSAVRVFHRLRSSRQQLQGEAAAGRRGILRQLAAEGPRTVPQLARTRGVSRQHIQGLVNQLAANRWVELVANPEHKRSRLVRITAAGQRRLLQLQQQEAPLLESLAGQFSQRELQSTQRVLAGIEAYFAHGEVIQ